jgi:hypothetical protein
MQAEAARQEIMRMVVTRNLTSNNANSSALGPTQGKLEFNMLRFDDGTLCFNNMYV